MVPLHVDNASHSLQLATKLFMFSMDAANLGAKVESVSRLHVDRCDNLYLLLAGSKRFT